MSVDWMEKIKALVEEEQREDEEKLTREQEWLKETRELMSRALSEEAWESLGLNPWEAQKEGSAVWTRGQTALGGETILVNAASMHGGYSLAPITGIEMTLGDGPRVRVDLKVPLRVPNPENASSDYILGVQEENLEKIAAGLLYVVRLRARTRKEERNAASKRWADRIAQYGHYGWVAQVKARKAREDLAKLAEDEYLTPKRKAEVEAKLGAIAEESEKEVAAQAKRRAAAAEAVLALADEQEGVHRAYDEAVRAFAWERTESLWAPLQVRHVRYTAASLGGKIVVAGVDVEEDEDFARAIEDALVKEVTVLDGPNDDGWYVTVGRSGHKSLLRVGAILDERMERFGPESKTIEESLPYYRSVPVGGRAGSSYYYVNAHPTLPEEYASLVSFPSTPEPPQPWPGLLDAALGDEEKQALGPDVIKRLNTLGARHELTRENARKAIDGELPKYPYDYDY